MDSDKNTLQRPGASILLKSAIVTVLAMLFSIPLLLLFFCALPGPIGFVLLIAPMIILQVPLVWLLVRLQLLPNVTFGRPTVPSELSNDAE